MHAVDSVVLLVFILLFIGIQFFSPDLTMFFLHPSFILDQRKLVNESMEGNTGRCNSNTGVEGVGVIVILVWVGG